MRHISKLLILILILLLTIVLNLKTHLGYVSEEARPKATFDKELIMPKVTKYHYKIYEELPESILRKIQGVSYLEGGPIGLEELSYVQLTYWNFDAKPQRGELIVNKQVALEVVEIFKEIYMANFPIAKMKLIDDYGADDDLSMAANNTSSFCVRKVRGSENYSKHSYGLAIDLNPVQNPFIAGGEVLPEAGQAYVNRQQGEKGMILRGDVVFTAFTKRGWTWGGDWKTLKDYQHFQK